MTLKAIVLGEWYALPGPLEATGLSALFLAVGGMIVSLGSRRGIGDEQFLRRWLDKRHDRRE